MARLLPIADQAQRVCTNRTEVPRPCPHLDCRYHLAHERRRRWQPDLSV
jgi:hypothetical protein